MEMPHDKFKRVAPKRVERLLREIRLIGNLGNRNHYHYTQEEMDKIFSTIEEELRIAKSRFSVKRTERFQL